MDEKNIEGINIFKMLYFDFMLVGTELVGKKIRDMPTNQPQ